MLITSLIPQAVPLANTVTAPLALPVTSVNTRRTYVPMASTFAFMGANASPMARIINATVPPRALIQPVFTASTSPRPSVTRRRRSFVSMAGSARKISVASAVTSTEDRKFPIVVFEKIATVFESLIALILPILSIPTTCTDTVNSE
jgi:hypothetical protein